MGYIDTTDKEPVIRDLSRGDDGQDVEAVQKILVRRGYSLLAAQVDGIFGRSTEACVVHFQWRHGLNMDGVVGPRTRVALGLTAKPAEIEGGQPTLTEIEGLELGLGEPLTDHVDVLMPDSSE